MKIIFLDIDGVLNYLGCKARVKSCLGIEDEKLALLKQLVDTTGAKIVLVSTWKTDWNNGPIEDLNPYGQYLVTRFNEYGLSIFDKTEDDVEHRGKGIKEWLAKHSDIESFCIIDDECFDYKAEMLFRKLIKTRFYEQGLEQVHVDAAIELLSKTS